MEQNEVDKLVSALTRYGLDEVRLTQSSNGTYKVVPNIRRMEQIARNLEATPKHFYVGNNWREGVNVFFEYKDE